MNTRKPARGQPQGSDAPPKSKAPPCLREERRDKDGAASQEEHSSDLSVGNSYWIELPTLEKTFWALDPMRRTVPTTMTRITASMMEYSATS